MHIDEISSEALKLDSHDRAVLAEIIWESLDDPFKKNNDISDDEAIQLSKQRNDEIDSGEVTPVPHHELMKKLRNEN
jgi:putative addiction module component (TIGR02574 family)